jgi:hypothetical protein
MVLGRLECSISSISYESSLIITKDKVLKEGKIVSSDWRILNPKPPPPFHFPPFVPKIFATPRVPVARATLPQSFRCAARPHDPIHPSIHIFRRQLSHILLFINNNNNNNNNIQLQKKQHVK